DCSPAHPFCMVSGCLAAAWQLLVPNLPLPYRLSKVLARASQQQPLTLGIEGQRSGIPFDGLGDSSVHTAAGVGVLIPQVIILANLGDFPGLGVCFFEPTRLMRPQTELLKLHQIDFSLTPKCAS